MSDAGPRVSEQTTDTYRLSAGVKGYLDNEVTWDVSATYARNDAKDSVENSIHAGNMEQAIYDDPSKWIGENQNITNEYLVDTGVIYTEKNEGGNEQLILAAGFSGVTEESDIGYAVGLESRYESGFYTPDEITQNGESTEAQQDPTEGDYAVQSIYSELSVPITDKFTVEGALRYDNYSTFGGATTWKLGATYRFNDKFMMRSVAATGFRAPNVSELYGGNTGSFDFLEDPWGNEEDPQILVNYTSDENLQPEESESFIFGFVWEIAQGLSTTADYWSFDITDAISRIDVQNAMDQCFAGDFTACQSVNITPDGDLSNMTAVLTNIGYQKTSGIDWNMSWSADIFKVSLDTTYVIEFEQDDIDYTGKIDGNMGGYSELKSNLTVQMDISEDPNVMYNAQFIQGMDGNAWGHEYSTDNVVYHNVSAAYHVNDDVLLSGGVKNVFDTEPETVPDGNDMNTVPSIYDVVGRTFYLSTTVKF